jgi:hypothetical protein
MSLALLRDAVRAEIKSGDKSDRKALRQLSETERQAVRAMRRQMRGANGTRTQDIESLIWF